ncbi:lantibiotic immunity ABC transporter MutE/EpiE family permease subunit [Fodinisporobacter ferrooxydans]|uniref:Lantibiotic immunity ABC transporter MutE/EpiE family permease subunit n=1 Tax=Fodinisporobacter ferrooxydans TaxID=2901836 RepID=A0ABY4CL86_9BACL|nr:lantibiotic immunity ABC transporter MutE/EpiE family permease subunit [Alicyclobacillaceae bacterium MYW30-H2]
MINMAKSELLKYKRTFARRIIVFAPLLFILIALPQKLFMPADYLRPWQLLLDQVYNWWPVLFVPLGTALLASLVQLQEKKAGNYRNMRVHNIPAFLIWIGKVAGMAYHMFLATWILFAAVIASGWMTAGGAIPWIKIFAGGFAIWLTSLAVIPLQLWAAAWKGTFFSMILGLAGLIAGVMAASDPYWIYVPWSWPTRLMSAIIGVHPNGIALNPSDPLRDPSVIPVGIAVSFVAFIMFTLLTAVWFERREAS